MPSLCDRPDKNKRAVALNVVVSDRQNHYKGALCTMLTAHSSMHAVGMRRRNESVKGEG